MELAPLIQDLAVMLAVAGLITLAFKRIHQPVVLGYLLAGMLLGPHRVRVHALNDLPGIRTWGQLGVIFLMFALGLEFSFRRLARAGAAVISTALIEVAGVTLLGLAVCRWGLGFGDRESFFVGAILSISSTTLIVKALRDLGVHARRASQLVYGILVVEDLLAILWVVALGSLGWPGGIAGAALLTSAGSLLLVITGWFVVGYLLVPRFFGFAGRWINDEMLTVLALALCLGLAVVAARIGYSVALGAFIMGSILAESHVSSRIERVIWPLRDLFGAVFFVWVGMLLEPAAIAADPGTLAALTAVVVLGKLGFVALGAALSGQSLRVALQAASSMTQIGEFSFIIAATGVGAGAIRPPLYPLVIAVSVVSAFVTPYLIRLFDAHAARAEELLPEALRARHLTYRNWIREQNWHGARADRLKAIALRWGLNAVIAALVFRAVGYWGEWRGWPAWAAALLASSPFIVGMDRAWRTAPGRFATVVWLAWLTTWILSIRAAALVVGVLAFVLLVRFRNRLDRFYGWAERQFLGSFKPADPAPADEAGRHLLPWDAHLLKLRVHPNSEVVGQTLKELDFRHRYGLNVVAIRRGTRTRAAPAPNEKLLPFDELLVLGTDEQLVGAREAVEQAGDADEASPRDLSAYQLRSLYVNAGSPLRGKTIRDSSLREEQGAMVVGLERGDRRMLDPDSDTLIKAGDVLWLVGER
jgi:CPA2 family monovalent cation:H+ antiporter-2